VESEIMAKLFLTSPQREMVGRVLSVILDSPVKSVSNLQNDLFKIEFGSGTKTIKCVLFYYKDKGTLSLILEYTQSQEYDFILLAVPTPLDVENGVWSSEVADLLIGSFPNLKKVMGLFWSTSGLPCYWKEQLFLVELKSNFPDISLTHINAIHPERLLSKDFLGIKSQEENYKPRPIRFRRTRTILSNKSRTLFSRHPDKFLTLWQRLPKSLRSFVRRVLP
jgi:hypothetical protein